MSTSVVNKLLSLVFVLIMFANICPANESNPSEKFSNHLKHYWDDKDPKQMNTEELEQHLVDYIYIAMHAPTEMRKDSWRKLSDLFPESQPHRMVVDYLGTRESPLYAPEMLEEYLQTVSDYLPAESLYKARVDYMLTGIRKNRPGSVIADLSLTMGYTGEQTTLHKLIKAQNKPTKVLLYDPECDECKELIERLKVANDGEGVIAVTVTGETGKKLPSQWICVIPDEEELDEGYYLPQLPVLYRVTPDAVVLP